MVKISWKAVLPAAIIAGAAPIWGMAASPASKLSDSGPDSSAAPTTATVHALERYAVETSEDWATLSDYVAEVEVTSETPVHEDAASETSGKAGFELVGRDVHLMVRDVLWRSPTAPMELSKSVTIRAAGWLIDPASQKELAVVQDGRSRLQKGQTYAIGLRYYDAQCAEGDEPLEAQWGLVNSGAAIPVTDGILGPGEVEGSQLTLTEYRQAAVKANATFNRTVAGQATRALTHELLQAERTLKLATTARPVETRCPAAK